MNDRDTPTWHYPTDRSVMPTLRLVTRGRLRSCPWPHGVMRSHVAWLPQPRSRRERLRGLVTGRKVWIYRATGPMPDPPPTDVWWPLQPGLIGRDYYYVTPDPAELLSLGRDPEGE